jgi:hypothetical protein
MASLWQPALPLLSLCSKNPKSWFGTPSLARLLTPSYVGNRAEQVLAP